MIAKFSQKLALTSALFLSHFAIASGIDPYLTLSPPTLTNGQVQFSLSGEPGATCIIESSLDFSNWTPMLTNSGSGANRIITLNATEAANFYRAAISSFAPPAYALAAATTINANGNSFVTDSFNSSDPHLSTDHLYDPSKATANGDVATVQGIINTSSNFIGGNLFIGPAADFASGTSTVFGSVYTNRTLTFPEVTLPSLGSPVPAPVIANTNFLITSGYYAVTNSLSIYVAPGITATILVTTPNFNLNLRLDGGMTNSGAAYIYLAGTNATFSNILNFRARNLRIYGLPSLTNVTLTGMAEFSGEIYAPSADVVLAGVANIQNIIGACIANSVTLNGHYDFHFDQDLLGTGQFP